jgi:hypothetical protein
MSITAAPDLGPSPLDLDALRRPQMRRGAPLSTGSLSHQPKAIASETFFYEIFWLAAGDKKLLADFIGRANSEELRKLNHDYVRITQLSFELRKRLKKTNLPPTVRSAGEEELRWAERNLVSAIMRA